MVIAMGMGTTFESCYLGIPRVCISLPWSEEETTTGKMLEREGAAFSIPLNELDVEKMTEIIFNIFDDSTLRNELITKGRKLVPKSGLDDAAQLILETLS
jgi:UDP-N-acetylglucosamine:LPS N-acetylglucosamine transferase